MRMGLFFTFVIIMLSFMYFYCTFLFTLSSHIPLNLHLANMRRNHTMFYSISWTRMHTTKNGLYHMDHQDCVHLGSSTVNVYYIMIIIKTLWKQLLIDRITLSFTDKYYSSDQLGNRNSALGWQQAWSWGARRNANSNIVLPIHPSQCRRERS